MTPAINPPATLDDLMKVDGKAVLVAGRIVPIMPSGFLPGRVARRITRSLEDYVAAGNPGEPVSDNVGYGFDSPLPSGGQSLSPDASLYVGPPPPNPMKFIKGHPVFAAEVRSEHDYGPAKDWDYELKRKDYYFAGTGAVWAVDPVAQTVTLYTAADPTPPTVFGPGDTAHA